MSHRDRIPSARPPTEASGQAAVPFRKRSEQIWQVLVLTLQKLRELDGLRHSLESILEGTLPPVTDTAVLTLHQAADILAVRIRTVRKHCRLLEIDPDQPLEPEALSRLRESLAEARRRQHLATRNRTRQKSRPSPGPD